MTPDIKYLAQQLGHQLASKHWQITCAESCTGGGIAYAITSTSGSSAWFKKGFVSYSNEAKQDLLGVQLSTLEKWGAVSAQTVEEMAHGAAIQADAQVAIAVSGIAGPEGGSACKPVGTVYFGFSLHGHRSSLQKQFSGDRDAVRQQAIAFALAHTKDLIV
jgi:nicotinamide-nucleotide amidase